MNQAPPGRRRTRPDRPAPDGVTRSPFGARRRESRPETRRSQTRQCHTLNVEPLKVASRILGSRTGRIRVRDRRQPGEEDRENYRKNAARLDHTAMIASALGQVKDPSEGEASNGTGEKATWHGLCRKDLPGLKLIASVPIFRKLL